MNRERDERRRRRLVMLAAFVAITAGAAAGVELGYLAARWILGGG